MIVANSLEHETEKKEIETLLNGIRSRYGYDFTHYSQASLKRRLDRARNQAKLPSYTALLDRLFHDEGWFDLFLENMSITVTEMFRDPPVYRVLREKIIPLLKTFPFVKIWHAGCATGEEAYSMAILLHEEGFLDRARIYATDFNKHALEKAQQGIYHASKIEQYAANYKAAGGKAVFSDYYRTSYEWAKFKDYLRKRVTFSYHNLVTDGVFGEMNLICCRNVLIYFDHDLQDRVLDRFTESLHHGGFLCLGNKESLNFTSVKKYFDPVDAKQKIYKKCGASHV